MTAPSPRRDGGRSAALDGIRALAVVAVLCFHAHYRWAVGGYLGVDVFFVLSGYLITNVLLSTHRSWWGYRQFLVRRAVRLVPALVVAMAGASVAGWVSHLHEAVGRCDLLAVTYLMNTPLADQPHCTAMWHITWSLAAEQQFYLLWPLVLATLVLLLRPLARAVGPSSTADVVRHRVLTGVGVAALALWLLSLVRVGSLLHGGSSTSRVAFAPDGRSLVLLLGCALALLTARRPVPLRRADTGALLAVGVLLACFALGEMTTGLRVLGPVVAAGVGSALLVRAAAHAPRGSLVDRTLGARPVAWLGRASYSLYLWHEVAFRLAELVAPRGSVTAEVLRFALALAFAAASYHLVELPTQHWWAARARRSVRRLDLVTESHADHARPSGARLA